MACLIVTVSGWWVQGESWDLQEKGGGVGKGGWVWCSVCEVHAEMRGKKKWVACEDIRCWRWTPGKVEPLTERSGWVDLLSLLHWAQMWIWRRSITAPLPPLLLSAVRVSSLLPFSLSPRDTIFRTAQHLFLLSSSVSLFMNIKHHRTALDHWCLARNADNRDIDRAAWQGSTISSANTPHPLKVGNAFTLKLSDSTTAGLWITLCVRQLCMFPLMKTKNTHKW